MNTLLGYDVAKTFEANLVIVGQHMIRYAHSQVKNPRVKSCLKDIAIAKATRKTPAVEYEAAPLLLLAMWDEDDEYFFRTVERVAFTRPLKHHARSASNVLVELFYFLVVMA
ncbi:hypothetical protein MTO96_032944 [Rhipicephalus appendiculatus]